MRARTIENLKLDRVHVGEAAADAALNEAQLRCAHKVVIVVPQVIVDNTPIVQPIADALGDRLAGVYTDLVDHVPRDSVFRLVDYLEKQQADLVVTVGGAHRWTPSKLLWCV